MSEYLPKNLIRENMTTHSDHVVPLACLLIPLYEVAVDERTQEGLPQHERPH